MKSFKRYVSEKGSGQGLAIDSRKNEEEMLKEGFVAGTVVATKLASMRSKIQSERDLYKKIDLLADMIAFGTSAVAFATNHRGRK